MPSKRIAAGVVLVAATLFGVIVLLDGNGGVLAHLTRLVAAIRGPEWQIHVSILDGCSCPMFCPTYFHSQPAAHPPADGHGDAQRFCRFNRAVLVNHGKFHKVSLDDVKFWLSGDLGDDFADGEGDWAVLTFDRAATPEQRDAIGVIVKHLFPLRWKSFETREGVIEWRDDTHDVRLAARATDVARATLDGGQTAEITLQHTREAADPTFPARIENLRYWGSRDNDGFVLMPTQISAWRSGEHAFEYRDTSGFSITLQLDSSNAPPAPAE